MKIRKILLSLVLLSLASLGFYLYKLHVLVVESNKTFDFRCTQVNPHLISYKNSFLKAAECLKSGGMCSNEDLHRFLDEYLNGMEGYVPEESKWLDMQRAFMDRWDFKLIEPWYLKQAVEYQWKMYEGYRDTAEAMVSIVKHGNSGDDSNAIFTEAVNRRDDYSQKYSDAFDQAVAIKDWRKLFSRAPNPPGCTEENLTIPDTNGALFPDPATFPVYHDTAS